MHIYVTDSEISQKLTFYTQFLITEHPLHPWVRWDNFHGKEQASISHSGNTGVMVEKPNDAFVVNGMCWAERKAELDMKFLGKADTFHTKVAHGYYMNFKIIIS